MAGYVAMWGGGIGIPGVIKRHRIYVQIDFADARISGEFRDRPVASAAGREALLSSSQSKTWTAMDGFLHIGT